MCVIKEWFDGVNPVRLLWGAAYSLLGVFLLVAPVMSMDLLSLAISRKTEISWCFGWSSIGIGMGIINSRNKNGIRDKQFFHYVLYFGFGLFVSALAAFAIGTKDGILDYLMSALIGLSVGFVVERLNDLLPLK